MAGIGFPLRRLSQRDDLVGPLMSLGHAAVVAAGPWILVTLALKVVAYLTETADEAALQSFQGLVIYAFCISLVASAPFNMVAVRLVGDDLYSGRYRAVRPRFAATLVPSALSSAVLALLVEGALIGADVPALATGSACSALVAMIWTSLTYCAAVRDYQQITIGFTLGLVVAIAAAVGAAWKGGGDLAMVWGFNLGLVVVFVWLAATVLKTFPHADQKVSHHVREIMAGLRRYRVLTIGALAGALGMWIDKIVVWLSYIGEPVGRGLVHAPTYDAPIFLAMLCMLPALALFVTALETTFFETYRRFYVAIDRHATLDQIRKNRALLEQETISSLANVCLVQAVICAALVLIAPAVVTALGVKYQQLSLLRFGMIGVSFHFLFLACSSLLLFFNRHGEYAALQVLFLLALGTATNVSLQFGPAYLGLGYLVAAVACGLLAFLMLQRIMHRLDFLTFLAASSARKE